MIRRSNCEKVEHSVSFNVLTGAVLFTEQERPEENHVLMAHDVAEGNLKKAKMVSSSLKSGAWEAKFSFEIGRKRKGNIIFALNHEDASDEQKTVRRHWVDFQRLANGEFRACDPKSYILWDYFNWVDFCATRLGYIRHKPDSYEKLDDGIDTAVFYPANIRFDTNEQIVGIEVASLKKVYRLDEDPEWIMFGDL